MRRGYPRLLRKSYRREPAAKPPDMQQAATVATCHASGHYPDVHVNAEGISLLQLFRRIALLANSDTFTDAASACLQGTCAAMGWDAGHVYLERRDVLPGRLVSARVWHLSDPERFAPFREATEALEFAAGVGLPGEAWQTGKPVWRNDIGSATEMPRFRVAKQAGFKSAVAFPIKIGARTAGVLEFFGINAFGADAGLVTLMSDVGVLLGTTLERDRAARGMRQSNQRFFDFIEHAADAIVVHDSQGVLKHVNPAACALLGHSREALLRAKVWELMVGLPRSRAVRQWAEMPLAVPQPFERLLRKAGGALLVANERACAFESDGRRMIVVTYRDVTAEKDRERALIHEIDQRRQAEQLARAQADALVQTLDAVATEQRIDAVLSNVLRAIAQQLQAQGAGLWVVGPDGRQIVPQLYCEDGQVIPASQSTHPAMQRIADLTDEHPLVQQMIVTRRPLVHEIATDTVIQPEIRNHLKSKAITTVLTIPLFMKERLVGFLTARRGGPAHFSDEHVRIGQALAHQASLALELTRLAHIARRSAVADERARLAGDIHDALAQSFTAVIVQLEAARRAVSKSAADSHLQQATQAAREGLAAARRSVAAVRATSDDPVSLIARVSEELSRATSFSTQKVNLSVRGEPIEMAAGVAEPLVRVVQEALTNATRHAGGAAVRVGVEFAPGAAAVVVEDDGPGFDPAASPDGFGLRIMRERVELAGGSLSLDAAPGRGTRIRATMPVRGGKSE